MREGAAVRRNSTWDCIILALTACASPGQWTLHIMLTRFHRDCRAPQVMKRSEVCIE